MLKSWNEMRSLDIRKYVKQRDKADYLPWASCLMLLHENGADEVQFFAETNKDGSSLFMADKMFGKEGKANQCYEVRVRVSIDGKEYALSYPVLNGIHPVNDGAMNQNAVHKAQMRAFVKCVAINTGLGFDLWMDDSDIREDTEDLSKHSIFAIKERMQIAYTNAIKRGLSTKEIAGAVGMTEEMVRVVFSYFDQLVEFEKRLGGL